MTVTKKHMDILKNITTQHPGPHTANLSASRVTVDWWYPETKSRKIITVEMSARGLIYLDWSAADQRSTRMLLAFSGKIEEVDEALDLLFKDARP